jgi:cell division protein FtsW (lipid II flippase)
MSNEEKRAWIMVIVTVVAYGAYLVAILSRSATVPLPDVDYVGPLLWSIGASIGAGILLGIVVGIFSSKRDRQRDERDREINRTGEYIGQSFVVIGGVVALLLAVVEAPHFFIANAVYLAFVLSALLGSTAKIVAYRKGFVGW